MQHEPRRRRSWLIFDVRQMSTRIFFWLLTLAAFGCQRASLNADRNLQTAKDASVLVRAMRTPLGAFQQHVGRFPTTEEGLASLFRCPAGEEQKWRGPYIDPHVIPVDPWGRPVQYRHPGVKSSLGFDVWSFGPDGIRSDDDIGNWP